MEPRRSAQPHSDLARYSAGDRAGTGPDAGRHFGALATAEDSTWNVHFRVTPRGPGLRYLQLTDPDVDDISADDKSYRKGGRT